MTSNALFMSVAESMVILGPIFQVGWCSACSGVTPARSAGLLSRKAPPDAVMMSFETPSWSPAMACQMALGSLSRGSTLTPRSCARRISISPAITKDSLLARAMSLPASMAARVGSRATSPTVAVTTRSTSESRTISSMEHSAEPLEARKAFSEGVPSHETNLGPNSRTWDSRRFRLRRAASPTTLRAPGNDLTTSRVWVPTEPVEPSSARPFTERSMQ